MYAVKTTVRVKHDAIDTLAAKFRDLNPAIVRTQPDWRGARMLVDRERSEITVIALWTRAESYLAMAQSPAFTRSMRRFSGYFTSPPEVRVMEVAVEMTPESVARGGDG
ncbi:antibiotic biosynthesis monooxygenase [Psychromarinibacter sp. C21-152]|uniref:Antibiotic biosynthesis monooxygenase n=1 Tax=Psychromarinibacter sediminicola TaxID=3033385 RepID=A0AAE3TBI2_9RHOB|nr:antibiotic biosynthesis monooxygenase [Psychromarinibacter sediminicola]MDF0602725.1 antibiotic biosynthesis monooxygenase [Psychromarinibacter sediminicola]